MSIKEILNRHLDTTPVECANCGWQGERGRANHIYKPLPFSDDPELVSQCPKCDSEDLRELLMEGAVA